MNTYTIYLAGDLFDHKHLAGNLMLARAIEKQSKGRFELVLPQELEQSSGRSTDIRNNDIRLLVECDLALFNFDGVDLDSGTVVEFMIAKMLNIPCVILRTDFRAAGDQIEGGDPWNLMASGYPSTEKLILNAMEIYKRFQHLPNPLENIYEEYSAELIESFDSVLDSDLSLSVAKSKDLYQHLNIMLGAGFDLTDEEIEEILNSKLEKNLVSIF